MLILRFGVLLRCLLAFNVDGLDLRHRERSLLEVLKLHWKWMLWIKFLDSLLAQEAILSLSLQAMGLLPHLGLETGGYDGVWL